VAGHDSRFPYPDLLFKSASQPNSPTQRLLLCYVKISIEPQGPKENQDFF
jgi:hypothetical protein